MIRTKEDAMELLDRYLQAIKKQLPRNRQNDILAELRANYEAQLEDKEAALGRPLTTGEAEDWLRQLGAPMVVAARYLPQQYVIGPAIFPIYWYVLKMVMGWAAVIYTIVSVVTLAFGSHGADDIAAAVMRVPGMLFGVAAWLTLLFAIAEFVANRYPEKLPPIPGFNREWSPSKLPPLDVASRSKKPRSFSHAVAKVIFSVLFIGWLLLIPEHPFVILGPNWEYLQQQPFTIAHICVIFYWCLVALSIIELKLRLFNLGHERWQRPHPLQRIFLKALALIPLGVLLSAPNQMLIELRNPVLDSARYAETVHSFNTGIHSALTVVAIIVSLQLAWAVYIWLRDRNLKRPA